MDNIKIPPHSTEAEESVLGAILIDKDAIISVAEFLRPEHFYNDNNAFVYDAILQLYEERSPIDFVTLSDKLKKSKNLTKIGGSAHLAELTDKVPTAANVEKYGHIIKDLYAKRQLISAAKKISESAFDEGIEADKALDRAEFEIFSLSQKHLKQSFIPVKEALSESFDRLDELHKKAGGLRGVPTGFRDLDNLLAGLQPSNLLILAARPGIGKTAFGLNIARSIAVDYKLPVGIFSVEMSKEELTDRLLVRQSEIDAWKLKTGRLEEEDFSRFSEAMGILADAPFYIDDTPGISILEMRTKARRLQVENGLQLLIIDYLQLVRGRNLENRVQEVSEISMGIKNLARELKIPIIAMSQLSRAVEVRGGSRPRLADLRESGCLTGDTKILRADTGEILTMKELFESQKETPVFTLSEDLKIEPCLMKRVFSSGVKEVFRLVFRSGREIRASSNHPFYTVLGWKRLERIKIGDHLATARNLPLITNTQNCDLNKIILLAHFLGDGCYLKRQPLHYTSGNQNNLLAVEEAAKNAFGLEARKVKQKNWYHLYFSGDPQQKIANPITEWFKSLGIYNQRSSEKIIPSFVFSLSLDQIAVFIKHLWATDGNFSFTSEEGCAIYYASTSKGLVLQLQHLLLLFGVISRIRRTKKAGYKDGFIVNISGKTEQLKFLRIIGIYSKDEQIVEAINKLEGIKANPNLDVIPKGVWGLIEEERRNLDLTTREFHRKLNWAYSGTQRQGNGISRKRLEHINSVLKNVYLQNLYLSDLYWDEVVAIIEEGEEEVYDAVVEKNHNFLANNIIVHNSIEQDADVVMFLYREDEEVFENVTLEIAKHRNGPTGVIKLRFVPSRVSFYPMETKRTE